MLRGKQAGFEHLGNPLSRNPRAKQVRHGADEDGLSLPLVRLIQPVQVERGLEAEGERGVLDLPAIPPNHQGPLQHRRVFLEFVSIEPLLGPFGHPAVGTLDFIDWFIIGAETGNRKGKVVPEKAWVKEIVDYCDAAGKPVFMKDSLIPIVDEALWRRSFPWEG